MKTRKMEGEEGKVSVASLLDDGSSATAVGNEAAELITGDTDPRDNLVMSVDADQLEQGESQELVMAVNEESGEQQLVAVSKDEPHLDGGKIVQQALEQAAVPQVEQEVPQFLVDGVQVANAGAGYIHQVDQQYEEGAGGVYMEEYSGVVENVEGAQVVAQSGEQKEDYRVSGTLSNHISKLLTHFVSMTRKESSELICTRMRMMASSLMKSSVS